MDDTEGLDICSITITNPRDSSPLEFISRDRLAQLHAIERAALRFKLADDEMQAAIQGVHEAFGA